MGAPRRAPNRGTHDDGPARRAPSRPIPKPPPAGWLYGIRAMVSAP